MQRGFTRATSAMLSNAAGIEMLPFVFLLSVGVRFFADSMYGVTGHRIVNLS